MEEPAVQQEKIEGSWEGGHDGGKADWKSECSLSSLLKHSCLLCWSSPRDMDVEETDERVLAKATEIRVRRPQHLALVCVCMCLCVGFLYICVNVFCFWYYIFFCKCGQGVYDICISVGVCSVFTLGLLHHWISHVMSWCCKTSLRLDEAVDTHVLSANLNYELCKTKVLWVPKCPRCLVCCYEINLISI